MNRPAWLEALLRELAKGAPRDALVIAPENHELPALLRARLPDTALEIVAPAPVATLPARRFALALAVDALESLAAPDARALLAALRDRIAEHTVLLVDLARAPLTEADLRGLAFRMLARDGSRALFGFDLYDYKDRPEWLNPRHWAHPELWDKHRW